MKCLVTGGAGFIGSHLAERLLSRGYEVTAIDDLSTGKEKNLAACFNHKHFTFAKKNIKDNLENLFKREKFDWVFHLAAKPRVQYSIDYPQETHDNNINGTLNLLLLSRKYQIKRFIFSSSSSVYGDQTTLPLTETMGLSPISPYALQKMTGEFYCRLFTLIYKLETVSLRYFNVYGPRQNPDGDYSNLIPKFIRLIKSGESPKIYGNGKQTRDFTYVSDVVRANILAATSRNKKVLGNYFNIGGGKNYSVNEVTKKILESLGSAIKPVHGPAVIEPKNTLADIRKAEILLKWKPEVSFEEGINLTCQYFCNLR